MPLKILSEADVGTLLSMSDCIRAVEEVMRIGSTAAIPRLVKPVSDGAGSLAVMPGELGEASILGAKLVSFFPDNPAAGLPAIQGYVLLFEANNGTPIALVDGAAVTALRTAAASAAATRILARTDSATLGILGCGVQAAAHIESIRVVRPIREVRVWGRSPSKVAEFAAQQSRIHGIPVSAVEARDAAACDVICTVTGASEPILLGEWVRPGTHINLVGAHSPTAREADSCLMGRARIYVDSLASALVEAGDILIPMSEGVIAKDAIVGELGDALGGRVDGRITVEEITVYKSLGIVAQDLAAAKRAYDRSRLNDYNLASIQEDVNASVKSNLAHQAVLASDASRPLRPE